MNKIIEERLIVLESVPFTHSKIFFGYGNISSAKKEVRMNEIIESIQNTLNYYLVKSLIIFYQDPLLIPYIKKKKMTNNQKISFVPNINDSFSTLFYYANEHLKGQVVLIMNADTYIGESFQKLNITQILRNKLTYIISR